ncbi:MAG: DUF3795 domain-containing protein [Theionarchaea archaeon]|nr:DUF3795 domain-containing protein [Theionarchaea archaeon]MBU7036398.1 DUF3795 domain-containing protein [Theionarchaea archaeon]
MDRIIAFCGLKCTECPAFLATQRDDDEARIKVAETWSSIYNSDFKPHDINCDGCISKKGQLFRYCTVCEIRKCGQKKGVINCGYCDEYACQRLQEFFSQASEAKKNLEHIRKTLYTL